MPMHIVLALVQAADSGQWSTVPILSVGAVFSIATAAVGYGVVKDRADSAKKDIAELARKMDQGFQSMRDEIRDVNRQVGHLSQDVGRLQGSQTPPHGFPRRSDHERDK